MATVNLGRIKPIFKGAYAGGTAYVVDDIVTSGNETFICILASTGNATSNATYWTKLASKGADGSNGSNGTDISTTLTTQGDILYRNGSGLQRLAKGTASQELRMNSGATAPEWHTPAVASSDVVKISTTTISGNPGEVGFKISSLSGGVLDFSTYRKFELQFEDVSHNHSSDYANFYGRFLNTSGTDLSNGDYNFGYFSKMQDNDTLYQNQGGEQTEFRMSRDYVGAQSNRGVTGTFEIFNSMSNTSSYTKTLFDFDVTNHDTAPKHERTMGFANYESVNALGGVNFYWNQGNFRNGGKIILIGHK
jgi:hypothetical protein